MGRLLVTNDSVWRNQLDVIFQNSGFGINCEFQEINAYKKLNYPVINYARAGDGYIAACGTYIYKEMGGADALCAIYEDIKMNGIEKVRRNIIGSCAICLKQNDVIKIFIDESNTYRFYYYVEGNRYLCTNSAYHIAKTINASINEDHFLMYGVCRVLSGDRSMYNGVKQLSVGKVIVIQNGKVKTENLQVTRKKYKFENKDEALKVLKEKIDEILRARKAVLKNNLLFLTGGVDSRLEFAMHLSNKEKLCTAYWRGKDLITNGTEEDKKLCQQMSEDHSVKFTFFDVSEDIDKSISSININRTNKYGDYSFVYAGNTKILSIFENMDRNIDFINYGIADEALRDMPDFEAQYTKEYTCEKLASDMFMRYNLQNEIFIKERKRAACLIAEEIRSDFEYGNNPTLSIEEAVHIFTCRRAYPDTGMTNFSNLFSNSFPIVMSPEVLDVINSVPYDWKKGSFLSLALTEVYRKELLTYPYYTHHHFEKYNPSDKKLYAPISYAMPRKIYHRFSDLWIFRKVAAKIVLPVLMRKYRKINREVYHYCVQVLAKSSFVNKSSVQLVLNEKQEYEDIGGYAQIVAVVKILDTLRV